MPITIYKRGRFYWITGDDAAGNRIHESTGLTDGAKADQVRIAREKEGLDLLLLGRKATYTFGDGAADYLAAGKDGRFLKPLILEFGDTAIAKLDGPTVRAAAKKLYPNAAYTTWNRQVITPVRAVINMAADAEKCPPKKIKGFRAKDPGARRSTKPRRRAVDRSYIDAFRAHCDNPRLSVMFLFMFVTGARLGDALKIEPDDLDLPNRLVTFRDMKNGEDGEGELTAELVFELQQITPKDGRVFGFKSRHGRLYSEIKATCARAGIPYLGTHQPGRHSFGTEMIVRNKVDLDTAARKGRWKSKRLLLDTYVHGEGDDVIEQVFGAKEPSETENDTKPEDTSHRSELNSRAKRKAG